MSRVSEPNRPAAVARARRRATAAGGLAVSRKYRLALDRYRRLAPYYTIGEVAKVMRVCRATAHKYQLATGVKCREYENRGPRKTRIGR